jgi:hypothetical protein
MAHIPADDIQELFTENKRKSWSGLHKILQQHKGKTEGIEDSVIDSLLMITQRMEQSGQPYPISSDELQRTLDSELNKVTA